MTISLKRRRVIKVRSEYEKALFLKQARKRIREIQAEDIERRMQGLPHPEYKKPPLH